MALVRDLKTLYALTLAPRGGSTPKERLESFYSRQADAYDEFRERLLPGRTELIDALPLENARVWIDFGGGTAANFEKAGARLDSLERAYVVDLCPSLLRVAEARILRRGWKNVRAVEADAGGFVPDERQVDVVTFSYSLTMMPDGLAVLEHALDLLKPGGTLGVVDFYVSRKHEAPGRVRHGWWTRTFWPIWFGFDDVFLTPESLGFLGRHLETLVVEESRARLPYVPFGQVPYYRFVGRKR